MAILPIDDTRKVTNTQFLKTLLILSACTLISSEHTVPIIWSISVVDTAVSLEI